MKTTRRSRAEGAGRRVHPHEWLWEPLATDPTFVLRSMFGTKAAYLDGKLVLCFCARHEPWCGVLVGTDATRHAALRAELPELAPHPTLPKWLYLPETADRFERTAAHLVALARRRDPRIGVLPAARKRSRKVRPTGRPPPSGRDQPAATRPKNKRRRPS